MNIEDALAKWQVHPYAGEASPWPANWWAVSNNEGIIAYFGNEVDAFRFRLMQVNFDLNGATNAQSST